ncbi:DUF979 domain-containing protein [Lysobacter sp. SG-8]|uniref:DUF979 domain-containing protein n=1 Tax=Marilutibacter penaei TaxID=2759900 RepID=A0A7W3YDV5_9GAMM|nr:DUF979 domain-containing protein [Lysobacter penaei]MBB1087452.1 DUF979 domain-containing protein [Lysobacter penaei]
MLGLELFYWILGGILLYAGLRNARERRYAHAAFWSLVAALFAGGRYVLEANAAGDPLPSRVAGATVLALAVLAPRMRREHLEEAPEAQRRASAARLGHRLFGPALLIPVVTVLVVLFGERVGWGGYRLFGAGSITLIGLALASILAALAAIRVTGETPRMALVEGRRLLDTMGWAALLPLVLATLGGVFGASGVGEAVAHLVSGVIPTDSRFACIVAYGLGMALFTIIMGNAFAAFPVMTAGIGLPLLILQHDANPAILGALGMLTGYCGTLLTPMAANFNLVPAALLELDDPNGVIRAQVPTALPLLLVNLLLMYWLAFTF